LIMACLVYSENDINWYLVLFILFSSFFTIKRKTTGFLFRWSYCFFALTSELAQ